MLSLSENQVHSQLPLLTVALPGGTSTSFEVSSLEVSSASCLAPFLISVRRTVCPV